jgi:tRNA(Ile)-lysidine synthase
MTSLFLPLDQLASHVTRLYIAFSSGIDSVALLHSLLDYRDRYQLELWHINHGLQKNAQEMENFACNQAKLYQLEYRVDHLSFDDSTSNLEARARKKRYQLFAQSLTCNDALLTAHHMNDQAETLIQNLMRGSGPHGLSAIAMQRPLGDGLLFRPLLNQTRSAIEDYVAQYQLDWIEDPSNNSLMFDRNYTRHKVLPVFIQRWPSAIKQLHRVCEWQNENAELINELAAQDLKQCSEQRSFTTYRCLSIVEISNLSLARSKNLFRYWLKTHGKTLIGYKRLQQLISQLNARPDAMPLIEADGFSIRLYQGFLYIVDDMVKALPEVEYGIMIDESIEIPAIELKLSRIDLMNYLDLKDTGQQVTLRFRQNQAETGTLSFSHKLKRLFQKHHVPPWLRPLIPQIWINGELKELWLL